jgi:hypothetical protein
MQGNGLVKLEEPALNVGFNNGTQYQPGEKVRMNGVLYNILSSVPETKHYRCPRDFLKMVVPKDTPLAVRLSHLEQELLVCPHCGHKLGEWYIKMLKDDFQKRRSETFSMADVRRYREQQSIPEQVANGTDGDTEPC